MAQDAGGPGAQPGGARFNYQLNTWRQDSTERKHPMMTTNPMAGSAPSGMMNNLKQLLAHQTPPPAPVRKPVLAPVLTKNPFVQAQMINKQAFGKPLTPQPVALPPAIANRGQFGAPIEVKPPVVAMQPKPQTAPHLPESKSPAAAPHHIAYAGNGNVHGVLRHPGVMTPTKAIAGSLPTIASYGKNVGYTSGALVPTISSGGGTSSQTRLTGTILPSRH
jgi:hypothetical protein